MNAIVTGSESCELQLATGRVPAAAWAHLEDAQALVSQANAVLAQARAKVAQGRAAARKKGLAEGRTEGAREFAAALQALAEARAAVVAQVRAQVADIAVGIVAHIAPGLPARELVASMAAEAVQQMIFEPHLRVRLHPDALDAVDAAIKALGSLTLPDLELVGDAELDPLDCVIESEGGVVRAGFHQQLQQVNRVLARALGDDAGGGDEHAPA